MEVFSSSHLETWISDSATKASVAQIFINSTTKTCWLYVAWDALGVVSLWILLSRSQKNTEKLWTTKDASWRYQCLACHAHSSHHHLVDSHFVVRVFLSSSSHSLPAVTAIMYSVDVVAWNVADYVRRFRRQRYDNAPLSFYSIKVSLQNFPLFPRHFFFRSNGDIECIKKWEKSDFPLFPLLCHPKPLEAKAHKKASRERVKFVWNNKKLYDL